MKWKTLSLLPIIFIGLQCTPTQTSQHLRFAISFTKEMSDQAQDGRLLTYLPKILARIQESAPKGADTKSWKY